MTETLKPDDDAEERKLTDEHAAAAGGESVPPEDEEKKDWQAERAEDLEQDARDGRWVSRYPTSTGWHVRW